MKKTHHFETLQELARYSLEEQCLVPVVVAHLHLRVSAQRVRILIEEGRLSVFEFFGNQFLSFRQIENYRLTRRVGRPRKGCSAGADILVLGKYNLLRECETAQRSTFPVGGLVVTQAASN